MNKNGNFKDDEVPELNDVSQRVMKHTKSKMNKMFKLVLTLVEKETKDYGIDPRFFAKSKDKSAGFRLIRKILLDQGNDILNLLELILGEVEIVPKRAVVRIECDIEEEK